LSSHVFGSNTSASSWEAFWQVIQNLITILSQQNNLTEKHKDLLDALRWVKEYSAHTHTGLVQAFPCEINSGVIDNDSNMIPMTANIYVDDVLAAAALQENMLKPAAIIE
jgi:hypothetical protein